MSNSGSAQTSGRDEKPETDGLFPEGEAKPNGGRRPRKAKPKVEESAGPMPDEAQPAPETPRSAQKDAAASFMAATSKAQAFAAAVDGLLGAVRLGLPDPDVYFRVKPIEEVTNPDGTKTYLNQAIVSLYKLPDGARENPSEPRLWLVADDLVSAEEQRSRTISCV